MKNHEFQRFDIASVLRWRNYSLFYLLGFIFHAILALYSQNQRSFAWTTASKLHIWQSC
jgi:hypothetical protein